MRRCTMVQRASFGEETKRVVVRLRKVDAVATGDPSATAG